MPTVEASHRKGEGRLRGCGVDQSFKWEGDK